MSYSTGKPSGAGGASTPLILENSAPAPKPKTLLDALSRIQQYYIIEKTGQEIPSDFLTIKETLEFMNIGFRSGIMEGLFFAVFLPIAMIGFTRALDLLLPRMAHHPLIKVVLGLTALSPILINVVICSYLSKYYVGNITRKAISALLGGRTLSLILKGVLIFFVLFVASAWLTPDRALWVASYLGEYRDLAFQVLTILRPAMLQSALVTVAVFAVAIIVPFSSVWSIELVRRLRMRRYERFWRR